MKRPLAHTAALAIYRTLLDALLDVDWIDTAKLARVVNIPPIVARSPFIFWKTWLAVTRTTLGVPSGPGSETRKPVPTVRSPDPMGCSSSTVAPIRSTDMSMVMETKPRCRIAGVL